MNCTYKSGGMDMGKLKPGGGSTTTPANAGETGGADSGQAEGASTTATSGGGK